MAQGIPKKAYRPLTDEVVTEICELLKEGLSTQQACAIAKVSYQRFENLITGTTPERPDWAREIASARAVCVQVCLKRMGRKDVGTAEVKAAHHLLYAIDKRFREDKASTQAGVIVQLVQPGELEPGVLKVIQVEEGGKQKKIGPAGIEPPEEGG